MKLIVDECIADATKKVLEKEGFQLLEVKEILKRSATDEEIYNFATEKRIGIITHDKGFGKLHHSKNMKPPVIIVLEMKPPHPKTINKLLQKSFTNLDIHNLYKQEKLIIITSTVIRIRPKD